MTTCKNNLFFLAVQLRGALETGRSCARITKVVMVVSFSTKLTLIYIPVRSVGGGLVTKMPTGPMARFR